MDSNTDLEQQIQKCVDGELTQNEQRELFAILDKNQDQSEWRTLALAFVEDQIWGREMRQLDIGLRSEPDSTMLMRAESFSESAVHPADNNSSKSSRQSAGRFPLTTILGLLIALTAGWLIGDIVQNNRFPNQSISHKPRSTDESDRLAAKPLSPAPQLPGNTTTGSTAPANTLVSSPAMMEFDVTNGDETSRMKVPVYRDVQAYREFLNRTRDVESTEYYQRLRAQGMRLQTVRRTVTIPMGNGKLAIVPVESLTFDRSQ